MKGDIRINLLASYGKRDDFYFKEILKKLAFLIVIWGILIGAVHSFFVFAARHFKTELAKKEEISKSFNSILKEHEMLLEQKGEYQEVLYFLKGVFKRDIFYAQTLKSISLLVPEEIWFRELALRKERDREILDISASAGYLEIDKQMLEMINTFIDQLKKSDFSNNLILVDIKSAENTKERMMNFKISVDLKKQL